MERKKMTLQSLKVKSFVTIAENKHANQILGKSGCCLNETGGGENNCYTYGHMAVCNSTGNTDNQTGTLG